MKGGMTEVRDILGRKVTVVEGPITEAHQLRPGIYVAPADSPAYGPMKSMILREQVKYLGETFIEDGRPVVAVEVVAPPSSRSATPNPIRQVELQMGDDFFSKEYRNYKLWKEAWWREAIQNAVDAGARHISLDVRYIDANGSTTNDRWSAKLAEASCDDDGKGMSEDILIDKFIGVLGATGKEAGEEGVAGGFGKAKELLLFGWPGYQVHTKDTYAKGKGRRATTQPCEEVGLSPRKGTRLTVTMPGDEHAALQDAVRILEYSNLPKVTFYLGGVERKAHLTPGRFAADLADGALKVFYQKKRQGWDEPAILVRDRSGLFMFSVRPPRGFEGVVICEMQRRSVEMLTENRDGFVSPYSEAFEDFYTTLASDAIAALKPKKNVVRKKYVGKGKFQGESTIKQGARAVEAEAKLLEGLGSLEPGGNQGIGFSEDQKKRILETLRVFTPETVEVEDEAGEDVGDADAAIGEWQEGTSQTSFPSPKGEPAGGGGITGEEVLIDFRAPMSVIQTHLEADVRGAKHAESILRLLVWEPDFYIYNELEDWKPTAKFEPHRMSAKLMKLARFWAELVRWVLIQIGSDKLYGVGWHFDYQYDLATGDYQYTRGSCLTEGNESWILLNPFKGGNPKGKKFFSLTDKDDIRELFSVAVHECVHLETGVSSHNDKFSSALTRYIAKTAGKWSEIEAIRKAVNAKPTPEQAERMRRARAAAIEQERLAKRPKAAVGDFVSFETKQSKRYATSRVYGIVREAAKTSKGKALVKQEYSGTVEVKDADLTVEFAWANVDQSKWPKVGDKVVVDSFGWEKYAVVEGVDGIDAASHQGAATLDLLYSDNTRGYKQSTYCRVVGEDQDISRRPIQSIVRWVRRDQVLDQGLSPRRQMATVIYGKAKDPSKVTVVRRDVAGALHETEIREADLFEVVEQYERPSYYHFSVDPNLIGEFVEFKAFDGDTYLGKVVRGEAGSWVGKDEGAVPEEGEHIASEPSYIIRPRGRKGESEQALVRVYDPFILKVSPQTLMSQTERETYEKIKPIRPELAEKLLNAVIAESFPKE